MLGRLQEDLKVKTTSNTQFSLKQRCLPNILLNLIGNLLKAILNSTFNSLPLNSLAPIMKLLKLVRTPSPPPPSLSFFPSPPSFPPLFLFSPFSPPLRLFFCCLRSIG